MIKFFGRIRQRLLDNNKFSKYLFYAIGEIVLVVIGILIALQINNWNENRKLRLKEIRLLHEINSNLELSSIELQNLIDNNERWQGYNRKILDYLKNKRPYDQSLDVCFGTYFWTGKAQLTNAAYTQLKNDGLDIISNQELRKEIVYMFEDDFGQIKNEHEQWDIDYLAEIIYPIHVKLFRKYYPDSEHPLYDEFAKPMDYSELIENDEFINIVSENISLRRYSMNFKESLLERMQELEDEIQKEIDELEH